MLEGLLFYFEAAVNGLTQELIGTIDEENARITVSTLDWVENIDKLKASFRTAGTVSVAGTPQTSGITENDFRTELVYAVATWAGTRNYTVDFISPQTTGLPVMKIDTENRPITSTETWLEGAAYTIFDHNSEKIAEGTTDIKGRGNSTWEMPKKPFSLKLSKKASMLGMPEHKRWALLANYSDKTLLRTDTAFEMGTIFDALAWTPRSEHISLYLNDEYLGAYQLTEAIKIDANRVDIDEIKKKNPGGGYILEIDNRRGEVFNFTTTQGVVFCCSDPDDELDTIITGDTKTLFEKIQADVQYAEDVLYSDNFSDPDEGYRKYFDVDSFIDWYFVNEVTKNGDACFSLSVFMYYDPGKEKYCMGPLWDFDLALGNYDIVGGPEGFYIKGSIWISRLFEDAYFVSQVKNRWNEKKGEVASLVSYIDDRASLLHKSQQINFEKWNILNHWVWPNRVVAGTYQGEIAYLKSFLTERIVWLDTAISGL
jgi:hypothetical protein